jgi:hypothetical protein
VSEDSSHARDPSSDDDTRQDGVPRRRPLHPSAHLQTEHWIVGRGSLIRVGSLNPSCASVAKKRRIRLLTVNFIGGCDSFVLWLSAIGSGPEPSTGMPTPTAQSPARPLTSSYRFQLFSTLTLFGSIRSGSRTLIAAGEIPRGVGDLFPFSLVLIEGGMN